MVEEEARRLLGGAPVLIISTRWRAVANAAPIAWAMPTSINPPLIAVAVHPSRRTHDMIKYGEEFAINIPSKVLLNHTQWLGMVSNTVGDKLEASRLPNFRGRETDCPLLEGCVGWNRMHPARLLHHGRPHPLHRQGRLRPGRHRRLRFHSGMWGLDDDEYKP